ncbi:MAG: ABC transporter permease [Cytophagaceae bacterium]|nr:ABC transporter permease [Gemmatimonadaceae bacterium]
MSTLRHDLRSARRLLTKNPAFTGVAVLTLALGIGLNTAVFSVIDALLLRPLPGVRAADELVQIYRRHPGMEFGSSGPMNWRDVQARTKDVFTDVALWNFIPVNLSADGKAQRVFGQMVSANYFNVLGATALRGRLFVADEDRNPGAHPVVILSNATWQGMFGGDPQIIGKSVVLNGAPWEVIGVAQPDLRSPIPVISPAMYVPLMQIDQASPQNKGQLTTRSNNFMNQIARLKPGVTVEQARERMNAMMPALRADFPDDYRSNTGWSLVAQGSAGIHPTMRGAQVALSAVVMAVVVMLLLIACVNVANLFLSRARDRWREMAVRLSLGAQRKVLVRQLLIESLVFAAVAGAAGLLIAWWCMSLLNRIQLPMDVSFSPNLELSTPVLLFTVGATLVTGVLFGLAPALQATRPSLIPMLKGEAPAGDSRSRASRTLVIAQMALSLLLLVCAGLFLRNLRSATTIDKGFEGGNILLSDFDASLQGYEQGKARQFYRQLIERMTAIPTVTGASVSATIPLGLSNSDNGVTIDGYVPAADEQMSIQYDKVSSNYFQTMGIRFTSGRGFLTSDDSASQPVIVVNQRFVDRFWPGQDAVGKVVRTRGQERVIVGVVPTGKYQSLGEDPRAYMYFPIEQVFEGSVTLEVRTQGDPTAIIPILRSEVAAIDPNLPVSNVRTIDTHLGLALMPARLAGGALAVFGLLGLILSSVGIYGVMSYSVSQRTREIGIRMAIGAPRGEVVGLVMRQGLTLVAIGGAIGLAAALGASQLLRGVLYGANALDPVTFIGVPLILAGVAALAIWVPARRAASVDPVRAIKSE